MKRLLAFLVLIGGCLLVRSTQAKARKCFAPEPGDSRDFGFALALSDSYLAVGDPKANRVVLYSKANGHWSRTGDILPPEGSAAAKVGAGFGYDLDLDGSLLVIGAYTERINQLGVSYSGGVYKVLLDSPAEVKRIDAQEEGEISGFSVAADDGLIAFGIRRVEDPDRWAGRVKLWGSEVEQIAPPTDRAAESFGVDVEINNDLLLVGAPFDDTGAAWLFNLLQPDSAPQRLAIPDANMGSAMAISDQFAVVSAIYGYLPPGRTLIMNLEDGSINVLDGFGHYLSIDRNLLMQAYLGSSDGQIPARLELFDLSNAAAPRLITRRRGAYRAILRNGILVTVKITRSAPKLCIKQGIQ